MELKNFKLKQFAKQKPKLVEKYARILQYVEGFKTENPIVKLKLSEVEFIKKGIYAQDEEKLLKIVALVQGIELEEVQELRIVKFFALVNDVKKQIEAIYNRERNAFSNNEESIDKNAVKWEMVDGSKRVEKFGIINTLAEFHKGDYSKEEYYLNKSYNWVFVRLLREKTLKQIANDMDNIKIKSE